MAIILIASDKTKDFMILSDIIKANR